MTKYAVALPARISTGVGLTAALALALTAAGGTAAHAAEPTVGLGTATGYSTIAYNTVENTGPSVLSGNLGVSPGSAVVGFPPGLVSGPEGIHSADAVANIARLDATRAYVDAAGRSTTANVPVELGGTTLTAGVYTGGTLEVNGPQPLVLDAQGDPDAVFIFQAASTLVTGFASEVQLLNDADACNVFWQVGSSATLGESSTFVGTVLARRSVTATTSATIQGRLFAIGAAVTLDSNVFDSGDCEVVPAGVAAPTPGDDDDNGGDDDSDDSSGEDDGGDDSSNGSGGGGGGGAGDSDAAAAANELAATGDDHLPAIIAGGSALVVGAGLLAYSRRRRDPGSAHATAGAHRSGR